MIPNTQQVKKHRMRRLNTTIISLGVVVALMCLQATLPSYSSGKSELEEKTDAFLKVGDYERAFDLIDGYIQEYPAKSIGYAMLERLLTVGSAFLKDGERERALKLIDGFIQEYPEKPVGRAMLVKVLAPGGRTSDAFKEYYRYYKLSEEISPELLLEIVRGALNNNDEWVRSAAAETLGNLGDKKAAPSLIDFLGEIASSANYSGLSKAFLIGSVTSALEELADKRVVPALIRIFNESDETVQWSVAGVLGKLKAKSAAPFLIMGLRDGEERRSQFFVEALGELGDARAVPALIDVLNDSQTYDRVRAALALAKLGEERGVSVLIDILNDDNNVAQARAAEALGELGDERGVSALLDALNNNGNVARSAGGPITLGQNGDKRAVPALIGILNGRWQNSARQEAAIVLGELGDKRAIPALINAINNHNDYMKFYSDAPLDELHRSMKGRVKVRAAEALTRLGDKRGISYLMRVLNEGDDYLLGVGALEDNNSLRGTAAVVLAELGDIRILPILIEFVGGNEGIDLQFWAAEALVKLGE